MQKLGQFKRSLRATAMTLRLMQEQVAQQGTKAVIPKNVLIEG
jgi:hypothetical protein